MISPSDFTIFIVKFANNLNNNANTVCSCRPKDIFNWWWCQTLPLKIFSELACGSFRKHLSWTCLASSLVENIFRTPRTHSNATFLFLKTTLLNIDVAFMFSKSETLSSIQIWWKSSPVCFSILKTNIHRRDVEIFTISFDCFDREQIGTETRKMKNLPYFKRI